MVNLGDFVEVSFKGKITSMYFNYKGEKKFVVLAEDKSEAITVEENIFPVPTPEK